MRIVFLKGESATELLKATTLQEITVPAYTRADGTYVPQHRKMVHINTDRSREDVLAGRGSHSQREAHTRLSRLPGFADKPEDHRYAHILSHATGIQNRRSAAAQISGWRSRARGGQNPTPAQWQAFYQLSREQQAAELANVPDQSRLSAPAREVSAQADQAEAQPTSVVSPAPTPATASDGPTRDDVVRQQWSGIATDDYQNRQDEGRAPSSDVPDQITVGRYRDGRMFARFSFKDTDGAAGQAFVQSYMRQRGIEVDDDSISFSQSGDYHNDWIDVLVTSPAQAAQPAAPVTKPVRLNDMTMDRQPDGSWLTRGGVVNGVGSALAIAADVMAGVDTPVDQIHAYTDGARLRAVEALIRAGKDPEAMLDKLLPDSTNPRSGRREGETKTILGRTYVLRNGRWHRADQDPQTTQTYQIDGNTFRPAADGGWEVGSGDRWSRVRNIAFIDRLNRMRERGQASNAAQTVPAPTADIPANRFEMVGEGHNKFWTIAVRGSQVITHWGRIGSRGQSMVETRGSHEEAMALMGEKMASKRRGGYSEAGVSTIPLDVLPSDGASSRIILSQASNPASAPAAATTAQAVAAAETAGPVATPLPESEQAAIRSAMAVVQIPDGVSRWSNSATNQQARRRIDQLQELARAGDLDGVTNFSTSRSRANYQLVDDYRSALLAAAHSAREAAAATPAASTREIPLPPAISGANPNNTALIAAQRKVAALYAAAQSPNPVAALLAITTSRGNGYMNRADDYKAALLRHFNHDHAGNATSENSRSPAPAVRSVSSTPARPASPAPESDANLPAEQNPAYAANPGRKTVEQLGFVPRPNVPLNWTVRTSGVLHPSGELIPWPDDKMRDLARRYLSQPTGKQSLAKDHQQQMRSRLAPLHASFQRVETRLAQIAAERVAREREEAAARVARENAERRTMMERARGATRKFLDKLEALPDIHKPQSPVGANIRNFSGDFAAAGAKLGLTDVGMKEVVGRLVADYGSGVTFNASVSTSGDNIEMSFRGNDGTQINRVFKKSGGKYFVYHSYFAAGSRGQGAGKALFRTSLGVYKALGMTRIDVFANIDVGGYAWAKFGFLINANEWSALRSAFQRRVDRLNLSSPEVKQRLEQILQESNPRAMFALSDFKDGERNIGKELLLGNNWHGSLDLTDDMMHRRCIGYISQGRN